MPTENQDPSWTDLFGQVFFWIAMAAVFILRQWRNRRRNK